MAKFWLVVVGLAKTLFKTFQMIFFNNLGQ